MIFITSGLPLIHVFPDLPAAIVLGPPGKYITYLYSSVIKSLDS